MLNIKKRFFFIFILVLFIVLFRLLSIKFLPPGLSNDEIEYVISSKSYLLYGRDISGFSLPLSFLKTETDGRISIVPQFLLSIPLSLSSSYIVIRAFYIAVNLATAVILYLLVFKIFQDKKISLTAAIFFLINPWSVYLSNFIAESPVALLFYLSAITSLLIFDGWKIVISFLIFILAFFSYHGGKIIFLPIVITTILYKLIKWQIPKPKLKIYIAFAIFSALFFSFYIFLSLIIKNSDMLSRFQEVSLFDKKDILMAVDENRKNTIENPLTNILINKYTEEARRIIGQYLAVTSPDVLFLSGDRQAIHRFEYHGLFYLVDIPLIFLGLLEIYKKKKKTFLFLILLLLISPLPAALSKVGTSTVHRSFLLLPLLIILSAYGFATLLKKSSIPGKIATVVTIILLTISTIYFFHFYLFRLPVIGQEKYWLGEKILSKYISYSQGNDNFMVVTPKARSTFLRFTSFQDENTIKEVLKNSYPSNKEVSVYQLKNITFTNICPKKINGETIYAIDYKSDCKIEQTPDFVITNQKDAGAVFKIYNGKICKGISKTPYRRYHYERYYDIDKLDYNEFCQNWIFKQR